MRSPLRRLRRLAVRLVDLETLWLVEGLEPPDEPGSVPVRVPTAADWPSVASLIGERTVRSGMRRNDTCVVADDGGVIGCAWLSTSEQRLRRYNVRIRPKPGEAYVYGVFVDAAARKQGAGYSMLRALREAAVRQGSSCVLAHISPRNPITPHLFIDRLGDRVRERTQVLVLLNRFGVPLRTVQERDRGPSTLDATRTGRAG